MQGSANALTVSRDTVAELADFALARWKVKNNTFKALKDGCHLEQYFGHGGQTLASLRAMFNMIALPMRSTGELDCDAWKAAPARLVARYRILDHVRFLIC